MNIIEKLNWRYATKQFDSNKIIDPTTWQALEQSLVLTPSSFGLQPWKFIVVTSAELKQALLPHSWNQAQVTDCSHFVVFCAKENIKDQDIDHFLNSTIAARGGTREDLVAYENMMKGFLANMDDAAQLAWAKNQAYIALGQLMNVAAMLEVDACPMEGISPADFDQILELEGYKTVVACALGYRNAEDKYAELAKVRYNAAEVITHK